MKPPTLPMPSEPSRVEISRSLRLVFDLRRIWRMAMGVVSPEWIEQTENYSLMSILEQ
jgi:hypothetical protein